MLLGGGGVIRTQGPSGPLYYSVWNKANGADGLLHPSMSNDGINFTTRATYNTYTPHNTSDMGAPCLMVWNGLIWIAASRGVDFNWTGTNIEIASSPDGDNYTYVASPDFSSIAGGNINQVWVDTFFIDPIGGLPYLFLETDYNQSPFQEYVYITQAQNNTLTLWSTPTTVTGTGFPSSMQNVACRKLGNTYYLLFKDETTGYMQFATSTTGPGSGYTVQTSGNWAGWGTPKEAPTWLPNGGGHTVWLDADGSGIYISQSGNSDPTVGGSWGATRPVTCQFGPPQHGSVIFNPTGH